MAEREALTDVERRVYELLDREGGCSLQRVADAFGWASTRAAAFHLEALERKGWVRRRGRGWQRVEFLGPRAHAPGPGVVPAALVPPPRGWAVPVAGWVAAGAPLPQSGPDGDELSLGQLFGPSDVRVLRVRGDSMVEAHILDGDYVAVRPAAADDGGRVVVCELGPDRGHTLKVLRFLRGVPYLYPRNRDMDPIRLEARDDPRLVGVLVGLVRIPGKVGRG